MTWAMHLSPYQNMCVSHVPSFSIDRSSKDDGKGVRNQDMSSFREYSFPPQNTSTYPPQCEVSRNDEMIRLAFARVAPV
jgi:hypothetical protein